MAEHLAKVNSNTLSNHCLSKTIQNELFNLMSQKIVSQILDRLRKTKYYLIILNCTSDASHSEQLTVIVRFVNPKSVEMKKHFIEFVSIFEMSGDSLTEVVESA